MGYFECCLTYWAIRRLGLVQFIVIKDVEFLARLLTGINASFV